MKEMKFKAGDRVLICSKDYMEFLKRVDSNYDVVEDMYQYCDMVGIISEVYKRYEDDDDDEDNDKIFYLLESVDEHNLVIGDMGGWYYEQDMLSLVDSTVKYGTEVSFTDGVELALEISNILLDAKNKADSLREKGFSVEFVLDDESAFIRIDKNGEFFTINRK